MKKFAVRLISTVLASSVFMSQSVAGFAAENQTDEVTFLSSGDEVIITDEDEHDSDSNEDDVEENTTEEVQASDEETTFDADKQEADEAEALDSDLLDAEYEVTATDKLLKEYAASNGALEELENLKEGVDYVSKEIITLAASKEDAQKIAEIYKGNLKSYSNYIAVISLSDSEYSVEEAYEYSLDDDYALPFVEPNYVTEFEEPAEQLFGTQSYEDHFDSYLPSDNAFSDRWWEDNYNDPYLNPDNAGYQWHHAAINTYSAWGVTTGNPDIVVGVIDSGINPDHSEFEGHLKLVRDDEKGINNQEDAGANGEVLLSDPVGHGTHVAGIIGAGLNGKLGAGIAPNVTILPIRVSDEKGGVDLDRFFNALMYVGDLSIDEDSNLLSGGNIKADIINISIGFSNYSPMMELLINGVHDAGVTTVVSMGNNNANLKQYPAYFDNVIAVCSTNEAGKLSNFSTYGSWADISAPGSNINSCNVGDVNGYVLMSGTSMSTPVVAGACALYMSAYGHVDPDTMKRALQSSVTGSAGSGTGAGILDLAKLLGGDTTAPLVSIKASDETLIGEVRDGKTYTVPYDVALDSVISFTPLNYGGGSGDNTNTRIVYTTDGSMPSVSNGSLTNGILLERDESGNLKTLTVSDIVGDITSPEKVTIKAMAVTGMGVIGRVSTLTFTVDAGLDVKTEDLDDGLAVQITNVPQGIVAGKSYKFESLVTVNDPETTVSQNVVWKIESYTGGDLSKCKINEKNGTLTTVAGKAGTLVISCTTENSRAVDTIAVNITGDYPVNAMKLTTASGAKAVNLELQLDETGTGMDGTSDIVVLSTFTDTKNHNLLTDSTFSYQDKTVEWISSNEKVVIVDPGSDSSVSPRATVTAMGAGSAVITCRALDGSGKSAKINVTVSSSIKAKSITIRKQSESDKPITALTTHTGEGDIMLTSLAEYANGITNLNMPVWSSSNTKVVSITGEGFDARIKPLAKGTANIVCTTTDGSGKKATLRVTVVEYVSSIKISGQKYIAKGGTGSFAATVLPAAANNKKVKWEIVDNPDTANISINSANGKVTVKKTSICEENTAITIKATALDNSGVSSELYTFKVKDKAKSVTAVFDSENGYKNVIATGEAGAYKDHTIIIGSANNGTELAFTSSNPKVATVTYENNVATVKAVAKGLAKITASAQDGSGKKAVVNVSVVQLAETITVTGQANIARGNKATFKAAVMPAAANNKKINWYLGDADGNPVTAANGISVNNGTVTVSAGATAGQTYTVMATAADGGEAVCTGAKFTVTDHKTTAVEISTVEETVINRVNVPTYAKGVLTGLRLFDTNIPEEDNLLENQIVLSDSVYGTVNKTKTDITDAISVIWSSSNNNIARLTDNGDGTVTVTGLKAGTANITCTAQDGSGKKATVKVTVIKPASGINIVPARGLMQFGDNNGVKSYLATGKATTAVPQVGTAYGKPTVSKVAWDKDYELGFYNMNSGAYCPIPNSYKAEYQKSKAFFTVANGKVTACNVQKMYQGIYKYLAVAVDEPDYYLWKPMVTITARTTDGTDYSSRISYIMVEGSTKISFTTYRETANDYVGPAVKGGTCKIAVSPNYYGMSSYPVKIAYNGFTHNFNVNSSNTNVATAFASGSTLVIRPVGKGTTKITVTAMDGTNKKATITVKVTN